MIEEILQDDFDKAKTLIQQRFRIKNTSTTFEIMSPSDYNRFVKKDKFKKVTNSKLSRAAYFPSLDRVVFLVSKESKKMIRKQGQVFEFSHELGHAVENSLNPALMDEPVLASYQKRLLEKFACYGVAVEGIADRIAMEACLLSPLSIPGRTAKDKAHEMSYKFFCYLDDNMSSFLNASSPKKASWRYALIERLKREEGHDFLWDEYTFGFMFMQENADKSVLDIIKNPPRRYEEVLFPQVYAKRFS